MANVSNAVNMSFRVDKDLKKQADILFKKLGMNTSVALNMFLTQSVLEQGIPFIVTLRTNEPKRELLESLEEAKEIRNGTKKVQSYKNIKELKKALDE